MRGSFHDRSGDRIGFVLISLLGAALVAATLYRGKRGRIVLTGLACVMALLVLLPFATTYPVAAAPSFFWGQILAMISASISFLSALVIFADRTDFSEDYLLQIRSGQRNYPLVYWSLGLAVVTPPLGLAFSIVTLYKIHKSQGQLRGKGIAWAALLVSVALLAQAVLRSTL